MLRVPPIENQRMPHHPTQLSPRAHGQRLGEGVLFGGRVHANLDEFVVAQGRVDGGNYGIAGARLAHLNDGVEFVGLGAQEAALEALQSRVRFFAHPAHSTESRWRGRVQWVLCAFVLWFGVACATTAPPEPMAFAPTPRATAAPEAHAPRAFGDLQNTEAAPLLDPAPPENQSLLFARTVLAQEGSKKLDAVQREGVARALALAEAEHGLSVVITLAIVAQESRFDPRARGPSGSIGLMQLQPTTAREIAKLHGLAYQSDRTLLDPVQNVRIGLAYLAALRERFGSTDHAMAAYNIGPGNLNRLLKKRPLRHGPYLQKVHAHAESMRAEFGQPETAIGG